MYPVQLTEGLHRSLRTGAAKATCISEEVEESSAQRAW